MYMAVTEWLKHLCVFHFHNSYWFIDLGLSGSKGQLLKDVLVLLNYHTLLSELIIVVNVIGMHLLFVI